MMESYRRESDEVLYSDRGVTAVSRGAVSELKEAAARNARKRVRLCAHHSPGEKLHEMLIVHERGAYGRPHKHPGKTESMHVVEGEADLVVFDDDGSVVEVMGLGAYESGRIFFYRMDEPAFHTLLIRSDVLVFHETTDGPFDRKDTVFAGWAPGDGDVAGSARFVADLSKRIESIE